jgi:hypothetical protein
MFNTLIKVHARLHSTNFQSSVSKFNDNCDVTKRGRKKNERVFALRPQTPKNIIERLVALQTTGTSM